MLINFTFENFLSFRDEQNFSMEATKEKQHGQRIPHIKKFPLRILPVSAIYGANAAGKSNLIKALSFVKKMVIEGTKPNGNIPIQPFKMESKYIEKPLSFQVDILVDEIIYEYGFSLTKDKIIEEKLVAVNSSSKKVLFHRKNDKIKFDNKLENSINTDDDIKSQSILGFIFKNTRENQLFLKVAVDLNMKKFEHIYNWFYNLNILDPNTIFKNIIPIIDKESPLRIAMDQMINSFDTGISSLGEQDIDFNTIAFPENSKNEIFVAIHNGNTIEYIDKRTNERYIIKKDKKTQEVIAKKIITYHTNKNGEKIPFQVNEESDGTQRILDLLPMLYQLTQINASNVYIIDELDRSLHPLLLKGFIEHYLSHCNKGTRNQLIFTLHDTILFDQDILRRDEIWFVDKNNDGISNLDTLSDYNIRYDKKTLNFYLQGRLGAIPRITL